METGIVVLQTLAKIPQFTELHVHIDLCYFKR